MNVKEQGYNWYRFCFFFRKKNKVDPSDQRLPILAKVSLKHISCVEFHGGSNGTIKIQLEFWNPPVIRDNSWQIKIFEKFWKNVFYSEFYGESNGTTHFVLRHRNPPQNPIFRSLDSFCIIFRYFLHCWVGFFQICGDNEIRREISMWFVPKIVFLFFLSMMLRRFKESHRIFDSTATRAPTPRPDHRFIENG